jgi:uncharacterized protein YndB with AHSA1/START domain
MSATTDIHGPPHRHGRLPVIAVTFDEHDGGTRLTLHLVGPAEILTEESGVEKGWSELLDSLERFLASRVQRR